MAKMPLVSSWPGLGGTAAPRGPWWPAWAFGGCAPRGRSRLITRGGPFFGIHNSRRGQIRTPTIPLRLQIHVGSRSAKQLTRSDARPYTTKVRTIALAAAPHYRCTRAPRRRARNLALGECREMPYAPSASQAHVLPRVHIADFIPLAYDHMVFCDSSGPLRPVSGQRSAPAPSRPR